MTQEQSEVTASRKRATRVFIATVVVTALLTFGIAWLLTSIFRHKQEAQNPYIRFVEVTDTTTDPEIWGKNWPRQFDGYLRTADATHTQYGGSEGAPTRSRLEMDPWLVRMFAGYAFALD